MCWEIVAKEAETVYGCFVDWEERFFICPHCDEPIYEDDWRDADFSLNHYYDPRMGLKLYCPVCENIIINEYEEDEEDD